MVKNRRKNYNLTWKVSILRTKISKDGKHRQTNSRGGKRRKNNFMELHRPKKIPEGGKHRKKNSRMEGKHRFKKLLRVEGIIKKSDRGW